VIDLHNARFEERYLEVAPQSAQLVIADLNYGITDAEWDARQNLDDFWMAADHVLSPSGVVAVFASGTFTFDVYNSRPNWYRYDMPWIKNKSTGFLNAAKRPLLRHEWVLIFSASKNGFYNPVPTYSPTKSARAHRKAPRSAIYGGEDRPTTYKGKSNFRNPTTVLEFDVVNNDSPDRIHSFQKPVRLIARLLELYTRPNDLVVDFTFGSGATAVACIQKGRNFWSCEEMEKHYTPATKWINRILAAYDGTSMACATGVVNTALNFGLFSSLEDNYE